MSLIAIDNRLVIGKYLISVGSIYSLKSVMKDMGAIVEVAELGSHLGGKIVRSGGDGAFEMADGDLFKHG